MVVSAAMNTTPIADIESIADGIIVPAVTGKVKVIFEHKSGEGTNGPYTMQNFVLADDDGNEVSVTAFNHPDYTGLKGKVVTLAATKGQRGWAGLKKGSFVKKATGETVSKLELSKQGKLMDDASAAAYKATGTSPKIAPEPMPAPATQAPARANSAAPASLPAAGLSIGYEFNRFIQ
jgi:hypothetical protein